MMSQRVVLYLALVALLYLSTVGFSQAAPFPLNLWQPGQIIPLDIEHFPIPDDDDFSNAKPAQKGVKTKLNLKFHDSTNYEKVPCWKFEMSSSGPNPPAGFASQYILLVSKIDKSPLRVFLNDHFYKDSILIFPGHRMVHYPQDCFPLEFFSPLATSIRVQNRDYSLSIKREKQDRTIQIEASLESKSKDEKEVIVVRQKWLDGEKWWRQYERFINGKKNLHAEVPAEISLARERTVAANKVASPPLSKIVDRLRQSATQPGQNIVSSLRDIPAFQVKITVDFIAPTAQEIVDCLRAETQMDLTLPDNINQNRPALGSLSYRNAPAWLVLEQLAQSPLIQGKWQRSGDGYRLTSPLPPPPVITKTKATPPIHPSPVTAKPWRRYYLAGFLFFLILALALFIFRQRQAQPPGQADELRKAP